MNAGLASAPVPGARITYMQRMSTPTVIDIPHKLTRAEVRHRMRSRIGELPAHVPGGVAEVRSSWPGEDRMALEVAAMGQTLAATIDIEDRVVRVSIALPPMLSFFSGAIASAVRQKGGRLLLGDGAE